MQSILVSSLGAVSLTLGGIVAQTTVVAPCAADNTLYENPTGIVSNGKGPSLFVGQNASGGIRRGLLRFDIAAAVPPGAHIVAASLTLNVTQTNAFVPTLAHAHRVLAAWGEGNSVAVGGGGGGALAAAGDATWLHGSYPNVPWTNVGGDFAAVAAWDLSMPSFGTVSSPTSPGIAADVQFWLDHPNQNFGWLLKTDETSSLTAHRIDSRESAGSPPTLSITYLLPGQSGTWGTGCPVGAGTFGTAWSGAPIGGTTIQIVQSNGPANALGVNYFALDVDTVGLPLLPGCNVYLPLAQVIPGNVFLLGGAGGASSPFAVPAGFPGFLVVCQSIGLANNPLGFVLSNAALIDLQ